jgi:hypothetical protein
MGMSKITYLCNFSGVLNMKTYDQIMSNQHLTDLICAKKPGSALSVESDEILVYVGMDKEEGFKRVLYLVYDEEGLPEPREGKTEPVLLVDYMNMLDEGDYEILGKVGTLVENVVTHIIRDIQIGMPSPKPIKF